MKHIFKPALNLRTIKVCATCALIILKDGMVHCHREKGINEDVEDMLHWTKVCDRWISDDRKDNKRLK